MKRRTYDVHITVEVLVEDTRPHGDDDALLIEEHVTELLVDVCFEHEAEGSRWRHVMPAGRGAMLDAFGVKLQDLVGCDVRLVRDEPEPEPARADESRGVQ